MTGENNGAIPARRGTKVDTRRSGERTNQSEDKEEKATERQRVAEAGRYDECVGSAAQRWALEFCLHQCWRRGRRYHMRRGVHGEDWRIWQEGLRS